MSQCFKKYWQGKKPFWRAFTLWALLLPLAIILLQCEFFGILWLKDYTYWQSLTHNPLFSGIGQFLVTVPGAFWAVVFYPIFYQPPVIRILWMCRNNNTRPWPVVLVFSGYILYYIISVLLAISGLAMYVLSGL
jgi:hypothetical protein